MSSNGKSLRPAGYASALGLQPRAGTSAMAWLTKKNLGSGEFFVFMGVLVYMAVGAACGLIYLANVDETPGLVKRVAIAFGGYVIAYLGAAYRQLSQ